MHPDQNDRFLRSCCGMDQASLLSLQQPRQRETKCTQRSDLQHPSTRHSVTEMTMRRGLADDVYHGRTPKIRGGTGRGGMFFSRTATIEANKLRHPVWVSCAHLASIYTVRHNSTSNVPDQKLNANPEFRRGKTLFRLKRPALKRRKVPPGR